MTIAKAVHRIQFSLIESSSCSASQLFAVGSVLSRPDYEDVVVERSIAGLCGYPPCANALPINRDRRGRFRVSLSEHRVYDLEETYNYCSDVCVVKSRAFSRSLNAERVSDLSEAKIEQVLRSFGLSKAGGEVLEGGDLGIKNLSIKEKVDAGAGEVSFDQWIGPENAIEGYVPKRDRIGDSGSNFIRQHNSRKMIEVTGDSGMPFASSMFMRNDEVHSKDHFSVKQDVLETIVENIQSASSAKKKAKPKRSTPKTSNIDLKKNSEDSESNNMDFSTSVLAGKEFDDCNTFLTGQDISDMITKQLENVVLQEKRTRKSTGMSLPSKFKHHKSKDTTNEQFDHNNTMNVRDKIGTMSGKVYFNAENSLEALTRSVENLVVESQTSKKPSKLSKPKTKKKKAENNNDKLITESFVSVRDRDDSVSSNQPFPEEVLSKKINGEVGDVYLRKESEIKVTYISNYGISSENEASLNEPKIKSVGKLLKSSLKTSGSKAGSHTVKWADEENAVLEDKKVILQESFKEDFVNSAHFTSAEACAAALIQAAESVASGKIEVEEAVSEAGILILPQSQSLQVEREDSDDIYKLEQGIVKWPKKTVLLDTDMFEVEDSWHDTAPEGFSLKLSPFVTMWMALFGWINRSSLAYIYGYDESSQENLVFVNGKEYPRKVMLSDGQSLEIRKTLDGFICRMLPVLVKDQRLPLPVSTMEKFLGCLLDTMSFMDAIPSFKTRQWHMIVFLFIEALSVHRLPVLALYLLSRGTTFQQMLSSAQISNEEYEVMRDLILPFGKSAGFSI